MTIIYISEFGELREAELVHETPKGYKVRFSTPSGYEYVTQYYAECPHGNHRCFLSKNEAVADARKRLESEEVAARQELNRVMEKLERLASA